MASRQGCILLAVDGEPHTEEAMRWAVDLALGLGMTLRPVHVRDPYLKQFYNDIYAQGREEYLAHVQACLDEQARRVSDAFQASLREGLEQADSGQQSDWAVELMDGDPAEKLLERIDRGGVSLAVLGRRSRSSFAALRSRDVAERLESAGCRVPLLVVPEPTKKT